MGGGIVMLLVGFLVGGAVASVVWAVIVVGKRRAIEAQKAQVEQIMSSIGETLAEADAIETNFRSGVLAVGDFRRGLGDRINAVMRLLRTNMHALDAFFVKYAEQEARDYLRVIDNPERRKHDGPDFSAAPIPGAVDKAAMYEQPPAAPVPIADAADMGDMYELPPDAHTPDVVDAAAVDEVDDFEQFPAAPTPDVVDAAVIDEVDDFEQLPAAPTPDVVDAAVIDEVNDFEPPPAAPPAPITIADAVDDFEPPFAPPGAIYAPDRSEPPPPAPVADDTTSLYRLSTSAPVREEELVLGESPEDRNAAFTSGPAPAPITADTFAPPPAPAIPATDDSIEEFEAAFAQFEIPAAQTQAAEYEETGRFPMPATETPPNRQADGQEMATETNSIDRGAILNAMAASGQTPPPVQGPLMMPEPSEQDVQVPLDQVAQHIEREARREQQEHQGITGDDVVDSIDSFFKLN